MTVTTGARVTRSSGWASSVSTSRSSSSKLRSCTSAPNSRAIIVAVSTSRVVLIVIMIRLSRSFFRTSFVRSSSLSARSLTVMPSASVIVRVIGGGADGIDIGGTRGASRRRAAVALRARGRASAHRRPRRLAGPGRRRARGRPAGGGVPGRGGGARRAQRPATGAAAGRPATGGPARRAATCPASPGAAAGRPTWPIGPGRGGIAAAPPCAAEAAGPAAAASPRRASRSAAARSVRAAA